MAKNKLKSVVICDMEGRIETISEGSVEIFGYSEEELIGKKRVSLFSPGEVVLEHVPNWLKIASEEGEYVSKTVFIDRNGTPIPAKIRITPTFKDGEQVGFCGVTEVIEEAPEDIAPKISTMTKVFSWLVITRAPFLTAVIIPILIGAAWVANQGLISSFPVLKFWLALLAGIFMHVAANTFNDYFDWQSGTDQANNDYFLPYTGGSRAIELGLISEKALFKVASTSLLLSGGIGIYLALTSGYGVFAYGVAGAFLAFFYTAPPLRLAARRGLGELSIGLGFGPLATAGTVYALTGQNTISDFLVGIPIGLLTIAILWINQFPDEEADKATGKINLVVVMGKRLARWGYLFLIAAAFGSTIYWSLTRVFPISALLILGGVPTAIFASKVLMKEYAERTLIRANAATIKLHALSGILMAVGILWGEQISNLVSL